MFCETCRQTIHKFLAKFFFPFERGRGGKEEHYDMCYFFSVKQNVKDILIDGHRRKEEQKESDIYRNRLKKLNFENLGITSQVIIENELDFHGYGTAKIEIQQQPDDINPFTCELHQNLFDILEFYPAVKVIISLSLMKMMKATLTLESRKKKIDRSC